MTSWVEWWCHLLGITDLGAIQIALGIVAGGAALAVVYFLINVIMTIVVAIFTRRDMIE